MLEMVRLRAMSLKLSSLQVATSSFSMSLRVVSEPQAVRRERECSPHLAMTLVNPTCGEEERVVADGGIVGGKRPNPPSKIQHAL